MTNAKKPPRPHKLARLKKAKLSFKGLAKCNCGYCGKRIEKCACAEGEFG